MTVKTIVDDSLGGFITYDDELDVLFATDKDYPKPEKWKSVKGFPDLQLGYIEKMERVCVDRYCDEYEDQIVEHQCALRLDRARRNPYYGFDESLILNMGRGINLGILNILRKGQSKLEEIPRKKKPSILRRIFGTN
jgi:hypothetical protein